MDSIIRDCVPIIIKRGATKNQLEAIMKPYNKLDPLFDNDIKIIANILAYIYNENPQNHARRKNQRKKILDGIKILRELYPLKFNYVLKRDVIYTFNTTPINDVIIGQPNNVKRCDITIIPYTEELRRYARYIFLYISSDKNPNKHPIISKLPSDLVRYIALKWI